MSEVPASGLGGKGCSDNSGGYSHWQPIYAERGITLIPCGDNKIPLVKNPQKFGREASARIAGKFSDAGAFGYYCGRRNGITVLDVDTTEERVLADAMDRCGRTPMLVRTGSGKFHALYRHNNERRCVRAWEGLPIDLLGAGLAIAPPSRVAKGEYQIIEGHLDDLDRLPIMRELEGRLYNGSVGPRPRGDRSTMREGDGRNYQLWQRLMREAHYCDTHGQLLDRAHTLNEEFAQPMEHTEVTKITKSAWGYTDRGENRFGQHGVWFATPEANGLITSSQDDFLLLSYLRANNGPDSTFWAADGLANTLGWRRQRLAAARQSLIQRGYLKRLRGANQYTGPALYRWLSAGEKGVR